MYSVRFYCAAAAPGHESIPSHQCLGFRYAVARDGRGYIQIPAARDPEFALNTPSIARDVEGRWYRATQRWDEEIRPRLAAASAVARDEDSRRLYPEPPRIHRPSAPSSRATGARPVLKPKS